MCGAQAVEYRAPLRPARRVGDAVRTVRRHVAPLGRDRVLHGDVAALATAIRCGDFDSILPEALP
ncbi:MAG: hypothetical protein ACRENC_06265, partial [Gemmatimonadaceae bacterium]